VIRSNSLRLQLMAVFEDSRSWKRTAEPPAKKFQ
jgi:hypothetical protein